MRRAVVSLALLLLTAGAGRADDALKQALALEESLQHAAAKAEPSIACILVSRSDAYRKLERFDPRPRGPGQLGSYKPDHARLRGVSSDLANQLNMAAADHVPDGYGSGVVIDPAGLVLTNYHVVRGATKVFVRLPGKPGWYADIHAADERSDLAVLKLLDLRDRLPALPMGDGGKLRKGQFVVALANPFAAGFRDGSPSVSWGLVSNLRRRVPGEVNEVDRRRPRLHYYGVLLQTDLRLNLGTSGGALLDLKGNWVGLTTAQAAVAGGDTPGGFAIPLDGRLRNVIDVLARGLEVEYGFLGISLNPDFDGAVVENITPNGPAARAGLNRGERIVSVNGEPVHDRDDLFLNVAMALAGTEAQVGIAGRSQPVRVKLVKAYWPPSGPVIAANRPRPVFGLTVDHTSTMLRGLTGDRAGILPGVVVREVDPNSAAARAGLRPDADIITEVNGRAVDTPREFYDACKAAVSVELTLAENGRKVRLP